MNAAPKIAPRIQSIGAPSPQHASRIVGEMLAYLYARRREIQPKLTGVFDPAQFGSVIGQQRTFERFKRAAGSTALYLHLQTGKRARGRITLAEWTLATPEGKVVDDGPLPLGAGIAGIMSTYRIEHHRPAIRRGRVLTVSRHALIRLAERGDVRTVDELLLSIMSLWACSFAILFGSDDVWSNPPRGGAWQVPVAADAVAVLAPHRDGSRCLAALTVLDRSMANETAIAASLALVEPRTTLTTTEAAALAQLPSAAVPEAPGGAWSRLMPRPSGLAPAYLRECLDVLSADPPVLRWPLRSRADQ